MRKPAHAVKTEYSKEVERKEWIIFQSGIWGLHSYRGMCGKCRGKTLDSRRPHSERIRIEEESWFLSLVSRTMSVVQAMKGSALYLTLWCMSIL